MKKSFSILEIIFALSIISLVAAIAIPKFFSNVNLANKIKLKSDIMLIRDGINKFRNKLLLKNSGDGLSVLNKNDTKLLFANVLNFPIISKNNASGHWSQASNTTYKAWISNSISVTFSYDSDNYTFDCDIKKQYCKELSQ
jgi:type II secretory pathway pseudopilin PulG